MLLKDPPTKLVSAALELATWFATYNSPFADQLIIHGPGGVEVAIGRPGRNASDDLARAFRAEPTLMGAMTNAELQHKVRLLERELAELKAKKKRRKKG